MRQDRFKIDIPKRWVRRAVIAVAVGMLALPAMAWAADTFQDVPDSNIFHEDINWMAESGVTRGCNPPDNTEYCPSDNVTREQMAAFLHRMDTQDVFVTPGEADLNSHFAVVDADGTEIAGDQLSDVERDSEGAYTLTFAAPIDDCSWTGALGARDGSQITATHTLSLNAVDGDDTAIDVRVVDGTDTAADAPFNVTVTCNR